MGQYVCECGHVNLDIEVMSDGCCQKCERPIVHTLDPLVRCPFCTEGDFDLVGLKAHLAHGDCEPFNNTELAARVFCQAFNAANAERDPRGASPRNGPRSCSPSENSC